MRRTFLIRKMMNHSKFLVLFLAAILLFTLSGCALNGFAASDRTADDNSSVKNAVTPQDQADQAETNFNKPDTDNTENHNDVLNGDPGIIGYVMEIEGGRMLVVSSEPKNFNSTGGVSEFYDAIWFTDAPGDIQVGEKVKVWYDVVAESYPAQSQALKTEKVPAELPEGAVLNESEAIQKALASDTLKSDFVLVVKSIRYEKAEQRWIVRLKDALELTEHEVIVEESADAPNASHSLEIGMTPADTPEPLKADDDLQLGMLKVNMTRDEIMRVMKAELLRSEKEDLSRIPSEFLYYADDTVIHLVEGKIYSIEAASAEYPTPRGLKAGDTVEQLRRLYGEPDSITDAGVWVYSARGYDLFYVTVVGNTVTGIKVSLVM
jgi:hypothetical protein